VSPVVLRANNVDIRNNVKVIKKYHEKEQDPSKDRTLHEGDNPLF
jgi:hypothetical protein